MKVHTSLKIRTTLGLLVAAVILQVTTLFPFLSTDWIVNDELYKYGLQFDTVWYNLYQSYKNLFLIGLAVSIILISLSIAVVLRFTRNNRASLGLAEYLVPFLTVCINLFSIFNFTNLTNLTETDLYNYGLQFSFDWEVPLLTYTTLITSLIVLTSIATIITSFLIHFSARGVIIDKSLMGRAETIQIQTIELTSFILITAGSVALLTAVFYVSSILALIGLGLIFWGVLFTYIRKEEYAKTTIFNAAANQQIDTINQMIDELNFQGKPVYLPPKYFTKPEILKVFIPKRRETELPKTEQLQNQESKIFIREPRGILLTPPGLWLMKLLEKNIATDLTRVDLQCLQLKMPKTFVEDLEIAKNLEMEIKNDQVRVKIEYFADRMANKMETKDKARTQSTMESILSSAIACSLAKTTGQPIILIKKEESNNGKNEILEYQIISEELQRLP